MTATKVSKFSGIAKMDLQVRGASLHSCLLS